MTKQPKAPARSIDISVEIPVDIDRVWKALVEAEEIARWFPVEAEVEPGAGGTMTFMWGDDKFAVRVEEWEPPHHLRLAHVHPTPSRDAAEAGSGASVEATEASSGASTAASSGDGGEPAMTPLAIDYTLEARDGSTVVRLVHSGFGDAADWDDQFEAMTSGWSYFLRNLRHYLGRHRDVPRRLAWTRRTVGGRRDELWRRIFGTDGLDVTGPSLALLEGETYRGRLAAGLDISGKAVTIHPFRSFSGTVAELNDALLFVELEGTGERWHCGIYLSTYGLDPERNAEMDDLVEALGDRLLQPPAP